MPKVVSNFRHLYSKGLYLFVMNRNWFILDYEISIFQQACKILPLRVLLMHHLLFYKENLHDHENWDVNCFANFTLVKTLYNSKSQAHSLVLQLLDLSIATQKHFRIRSCFVLCIFQFAKLVKLFWFRLTSVLPKKSSWKRFSYYLTFLFSKT